MDSVLVSKLVSEFLNGPCEEVEKEACAMLVS